MVCGALVYTFVSFTGMHFNELVAGLSGAFPNVPVTIRTSPCVDQSHCPSGTGCFECWFSLTHDYLKVNQKVLIFLV